MLFLLVVLLPMGSAFAQELSPVGMYFYYGRQMTVDEIGKIASERFSMTGAYTDCVYVPSSDYSPSRAEVTQVFHCFNTTLEARAFSLEVKAQFGELDQPNPDVSAGADAQLNSTIRWSIFAHTFHTGWLGDITVGQTFWTSTGIWSLNDFANNEVRLSDNPSFPGQRWTFGWTQFALSSGPGGARHAFHCTTAVC